MKRFVSVLGVLLAALLLFGQGSSQPSPDPPEWIFGVWDLPPAFYGQERGVMANTPTLTFKSGSINADVYGGELRQTLGQDTDFELATADFNQQSTGSSYSISWRITRANYGLPTRSFRYVFYKPSESNPNVIEAEFNGKRIKLIRHRNANEYNCYVYTGGNGERLTLRANRGIESNRIGTLEEYTRVKVLDYGAFYSSYYTPDYTDSEGVEGWWVRVQTEDGKTGWCFSGYLAWCARE
jgi:hypothetical protein